VTTVVLGRRSGAVARPTTDRGLLAAFLEQDRLYSAYALCDLEEKEFGRTRWGAAYDGDDLIAVGLEYSGPTPQPVFVMGRTDGISAILRDVIRPRAAYIAARSTMLPACTTAPSSAAAFPIAVIDGPSSRSARSAQDR